MLVLEAVNPHGHTCIGAIRSLKPDCLSRTDGYPRLCRQALREETWEEGGDACSGGYCGARDSVIPCAEVVQDAH